MPEAKKAAPTPAVAPLPPGSRGTSARPERPILVIGVIGHTPAIPVPSDASLIVGGRRYLQLAPGGGRTLAIESDLGPALEAISAQLSRSQRGLGNRDQERVCVLASGDPGFFGIVRVLAERFGRDALDVRPAPSSVSLAFARLGMPWDDALVVSAHGRPLADAARLAATAAKAAVLVSPECPPEALGKELLGLGARHERAAVCSRLGGEDERVEVMDLPALASGTWDPLSVVVLFSDAVAAGSRWPGGRPEKSLAWGRSQDAFAHRDGMITKGEVRAIALGKLALPHSGVMWDVGAGSGSVAIECALLAPRLRVIALERDPLDVVRLRDNVAAHNVDVEVVEGEAPEALSRLPDPYRAFVGGGGLAVLDAVLSRLRSEGRVVATFAAMDRAIGAAERLGSMVQVNLGRTRPLSDGGLRLVAEHPVFVAWGPEGGQG